jgi:hypothetical protein
MLKTRGCAAIAIALERDVFLTLRVRTTAFATGVGID